MFESKFKDNIINLTFLFFKDYCPDSVERNLKIHKVDEMLLKLMQFLKIHIHSKNIFRSQILKILHNKHFIKQIEHHDNTIKSNGDYNVESFIIKILKRTNHNLHFRQTNSIYGMLCEFSKLKMIIRIEK